MRRFLLTVVLAVSWLAMPSLSQASLLSSLLTFDGPEHHDLFLGNPFQGGGEDKLQDDSLSAFVKGAGNTNPNAFEIGDVIWGILTLSEVNSSGQLSISLPPGQIALVFSAMIDSVGANGQFNLAPIGDMTNLLDLRQLLHPSVQNGLNDNTILTVLSSFSDPSVDPTLDPLNWDASQVGDEATGFSTANGWFWEFTADLIPGTDDFFQYLQAAVGLGGEDRGGLTITSSAFAAEWIKVDVLDYDGNIRYTDITLDIGTVNIASSDEIDRGWTFRDQSTFFVNPAPIPEPSSLLAWSILAGIGGAFAARRRRVSTRG